MGSEFSTHSAQVALVLFFGGGCFQASDRGRAQLHANHPESVSSLERRVRVHVRSSCISRVPKATLAACSILPRGRCAHGVTEDASQPS